MWLHDASLICSRVWTAGTTLFVPKRQLRVWDPHTDRHTDSVRVCVCDCVCVLAEGWLLLKRGAPVWIFPRLKSRRQPRAPALCNLAAPRCFQAFYQHYTLIREQQLQQQQLLSPRAAPLQRGAPQTRSLQFRMDSPPSLHLYHWLWRCCSLVGVPEEEAETDPLSAVSPFHWVFNLIELPQYTHLQDPKWECICICCFCSTISSRVSCATPSLS